MATPVVPTYVLIHGGTTTEGNAVSLSVRIGSRAGLVSSRPMSVTSRTATVGRPAPDFTLIDQHGAEFHLAEAVDDGPIVLVFLRGFG